jgi:hypothetical protein
MQTHIVLLLILSFIGCVQSQNWLGTYIVNSSCSTSSCCCVTGQINVIAVSANVDSFTTTLSGGLLCAGNSFYTANVTNTSSYVTSFTISIVTLTFTLSSDSLSINVTNSANALCGGYLRKNFTAASTSTSTSASTTASSFANSVSQSNIWLLFIMTLIGLMRSVRAMWKLKNWTILPFFGL